MCNDKYGEMYDFIKYLMYAIVYRIFILIPVLLNTLQFCKKLEELFLFVNF